MAAIAINGIAVKAPKHFQLQFKISMVQPVVMLTVICIVTGLLLNVNWQ